MVKVPAKPKSNGKKSPKSRRKPTSKQPPPVLKLFQPGGKAGPGRGHTKQEQLLKDITAKEGDLSWKELMKRGVATEQFVGKVLTLGIDDPRQVANIIHAVNTLYEEGMGPDQQQEVIEVRTNFPPVGAVDSDFSLYALQEENGRLKQEVERWREGVLNHDPLVVTPTGGDVSLGSIASDDSFAVSDLGSPYPADSDSSDPDGPGGWESLDLVFGV